MHYVVPSGNYVELGESEALWYFCKVGTFYWYACLVSYPHIPNITPVSVSKDQAHAVCGEVAPKARTGNMYTFSPEGHGSF